MSVVRALLSECIDYAGLFPPAGLDLRRTVENYGEYRAGADAWALGRLVLPISRVAEFAKEWPELAAQWPLALVIRGKVDDGTQGLLTETAGVHPPSIECEPMPYEAVSRAARIAVRCEAMYVEVDPTQDLEATIKAIAASGARAKIRTGGIVADAIPSSEQVAHFIRCCTVQRVLFKATAGLHHPVRGLHALTYKMGGDTALMHGFLNVLLASALLFSGGTIDMAMSLLEETSPETFRLAKDRVSWRDWTVTAQQLSEMRKGAMISFGSCSFTEPLEDLRAAGLLP